MLYPWDELLPILVTICSVRRRHWLWPSDSVPWRNIFIFLPVLAYYQLRSPVVYGGTGLTCQGIFAQRYGHCLSKEMEPNLTQHDWKNSLPKVSSGGCP